MTRRWFAIACVVAAFVPSIGAQSRTAKTSADPISGVWAGQLVWADKSRTVPITMDHHEEAGRLMLLPVCVRSG